MQVRLVIAQTLERLVHRQLLLLQFNAVGGQLRQNIGGRNRTKQTPFGIRLDRTCDGHLFQFLQESLSLFLFLRQTQRGLGAFLFD